MSIVAACRSRTAMKFAMLGITVFSRNHGVLANDNPPNNSIVRTLLLDVVSTIECCLSIIVLSQYFLLVDDLCLFESLALFVLRLDFM